LKKIPLFWIDFYVSALLDAIPSKYIAEQLRVPIRLFTDAEFDVFARDYGCVADEEKEKQAEEAPNRSWGPELLPWEDLVANHRDFRRLA
jgi:hypothetical protein